ncbi:E set domain-containing protein, partial [Meira miltonrushii]
MRQASAPAGLHKLEDETTVRRQNATQLDRHGTLISSASNPARRSKDLNRLLGNHSGKLSSSASSDAGSSLSSASAMSKRSNTSNSIMPQAVLEQGKSGKSRVDVDLILESELVVEGGMLTGRLEVKVRKNNTKDGHLMLSQPKVRVVGFEELVNDDTRHIFYHYATVIDGYNRQPLACFASQPDSEGYSVAKEGQHSIPFALELPVGKGAKGTYRGKHAVVRYIVIGSVKLKSENGSNRSIAHFYRHIDLYPYLNPAIVLAGSGKPVQARGSKGLFLGGSGKVHLIASLHRSSWVAGQRLYVHLRIDNETSKRVKSLTMTLIRTVILYRPRPEFDMALSAPDDPSETYIDPDACTTSTSRKKICEDVLEMGQKGAKGTVTARGWWTGVEAGEAVELSHNMKLPVDALTITRGRHVEVSYSLKISVGSSLSSDVSVELPVRIVNFVSLDPPP